MLLDPDSGVPLYVQVMHGLTEAIASEALPQDSELPSVRALGSELRVNYHTVARAYRELQSQGWIRRQRGGPYVVLSTAVAAADSLLADDLDSLCRHASLSGLSDADLVARLRQTLASRRLVQAESVVLEEGVGEQTSSSLEHPRFPLGVASLTTRPPAHPVPEEPR